MDGDGPMIAFLGDEVSALGLRLAGVECHHPPAREVPERFAELCSRARLILVTVEAAEAIGRVQLLRVQASEQPLVVVIPDARRHREPPDLAAAVRRQLGMAQ